MVLHTKTAHGAYNITALAVQLGIRCLSRVVRASLLNAMCRICFRIMFSNCRGPSCHNICIHAYIQIYLLRERKASKRERRRRGTGKERGREERECKIE